MTSINPLAQISGVTQRPKEPEQKEKEKEKERPKDTENTPANTPFNPLLLLKGSTPSQMQSYIKQQKEKKNESAQTPKPVATSKDSKDLGTGRIRLTSEATRSDAAPLPNGRIPGGCKCLSSGLQARCSSAAIGTSSGKTAGQSAALSGPASWLSAGSVASG